MVLRLFLFHGGKGTVFRADVADGRLQTVAPVAVEQIRDGIPVRIAASQLAGMLEITRDAGEAVVVVDRLQTGRLGAHRHRQGPRQLPGVDLAGPDVVVVAVTWLIA